MRQLQLEQVINNKIEKILSSTITFMVVVLLLSCSDSNNIKSVVITERMPDLTAEEFTMTYSDSANVVFRLVTPTVIKDSPPDGEPYSEFPDGFVIEKFDKNGEIEQFISADYGKEYTERNTLEALGDVVMTNIQGDTLKTEKITYDRNKELLFTDQFVTIIKKDKIITGIGMHSDSKFENRVINNPNIVMWVDPNRE